MKTYEAFAQNARCLLDPRFVESAEARQERLLELLPSGSGFDCGTKFVSADDSKIVFTTEFHHMNENGFYDGWTQHRVTVRASLSLGIDIVVSGRDRNGVKDYIAQAFSAVMLDEFEWIEKQ
jgi:hypothetical protein